MKSFVKVSEDGVLKLMVLLSFYYFAVYITIGCCYFTTHPVLINNGKENPKAKV